MIDNILALIHFDVCFALRKLEGQVKEKQLKILLIRSERKLFDTDMLKKYLSEVSIQNTFLLKDVISKSYKVIKLNNEDFSELEELERENSENFGFSTPVGENGFFSTSTPFECITIENKEIFYAINNEIGYKDFFEKGNFETFRSQHFAEKCGILINLITSAYPGLKTSPSIKPPSKFYALYHWIKIEMGTETQFAKNDNGQFLKSEIETFVKNSYPNCTSSQGFYRSFKDLDITKKTAIANSFGRGYKEKLITISNNDNKLITYLKNYPN